MNNTIRKAIILAFLVSAFIPQPSYSLPSERELSMMNTGNGDDYNYFTEEYYRNIDNLRQELERRENLPLYQTEQRYLPMNVRQQETVFYCGPACMQMVIESVTGQVISQATLAAQANTNPQDGTYVYQVVDTLNLYLNDRYQFVSINDIPMFSAVKASIDNGYPVVYHVKTRTLPGYSAEEDFGHFLAGYGYSYEIPDDVEPYSNSSSFLNQRLSYVDPYGPALGYHNVSYSELRTATQRNRGLFICD